MGQARAGAVDNHSAPLMRFEAQEFLKLKPGEYWRCPGRAVNSRPSRRIDHPGTATTGPLFGNATTEILLFDA